MQPQYYRHPETGELFELRPATVDEQSLREDLAYERQKARHIENKIDMRELRVAALQAAIAPLSDELGELYDQQEAAKERVAFCRDRVAGIVSAPALSGLTDNGATSPASENVDGTGEDDPEPDDSEDLDGSNDTEPSAEQSEAVEAELEVDQIIPIRRRARI